jgi:hypothetical protein
MLSYMKKEDHVKMLFDSYSASDLIDHFDNLEVELQSAAYELVSEDFKNEHRAIVYWLKKALRQLSEKRPANAVREICDN